MQTAEPLHRGADPATSAAKENQNLSHPNQLRTLTGLLFLPLSVITWHHARDYWVPMRGLFDEQIYFKHFVTLLFVLSGFIVAYRPPVKDIGTSLHFYLGRIARIWPIHVFCLVLLLFSISEVFTVRGQWTPIFICNLFMIQTWVPIAQWYWSYNSPSYATSTLLWCEIAFPLLCLGAQRSKALVLTVAGMIVLAVICLGNILHLPGDDLTHASLRGLLYVSPLVRLLEFATGVVTAFTYQRIAHRIKFSMLTASALEALAIGLFVFVNRHSSAWQVASTRYIGEAGAFWLHNSGDCFLPLALLIAVLATGRGVVSKFFGSKALVFLGEISLAFYMLHAVFSAYFYANFLAEQTLLPAFFFFASLFVAAHVIHAGVFEPIREQLVKQGTRLLSLKWPWLHPQHEGMQQFESPQSTVERYDKMRWRCLLAIEAAVAAVLFYFALPTIDHISAADAETIGKMAAVHDVEFEPWLKCRSAVADYSNGQVALNTVWQAEKSESVDFFITAEVQDKSGTILGSSRCAMDGRHQGVSSGALWSHTVRISLAANAQPVKVAIKLTRGKRSQLSPRSGLPANLADQDGHSQMIVPVK